MLNDDQIAKLRKDVRGARQRRWGLLLLIVFGAIYTLIKVIIINNICSQSGLTWPHIFTFLLARVDPDKMYMGTEILAANYLSEALLFIVVFVIVGSAAYINSKDVAVRNRLLLEFIDEKK